MFLADASSALVSDSAFPDSDPYFYLLQSNGRNSLCLLTGLDVETYSALLLECKLVRIRNNKDGSRSIQVHDDTWHQFLNSFHLSGGAVGWEDHAEFTKGAIKLAAIDGVTAGSDNTSATATMAMLRVGKVRSGEDTPQCTAINHGVEPPRMNAGMRRAKMTKLSEELRCNNLMCYTDVSRMVPGINEIYESDIIFSHSTNDNSAAGEKEMITLCLAKKKDEERTNSLSISPNSYMAGDLAFLAFMMGKENFSSQWCNWCRSTKQDWQTGRAIQSDEMWDINKIDAQVKKIAEDKLTGTDMVGVRRSPLAKIPFDNIIFAGLHAGIGIGNMITDHLEEFIDIEVEHLSDEEFRVRQTKRTTERDVKELRDEKDV